MIGALMAVEITAPEAAPLARWFDAHLPQVYAYVARRVEDRSAAEELTTSIMDRAAQALRAGELELAGLEPFVLRVASSAVADHARRARRSLPPGVRATDFDQGGDRVAAEAAGDEVAMRSFAGAVDADALRRTLGKLADVDRRVILLRYLDGLDGAALAAALGCSEDAVALRLHRALRAFRAIRAEAAIDAA
jgi:RNA polymerase sigma-70 factor (ECF subfamily)